MHQPIEPNQPQNPLIVPIPAGHTNQKESKMADEESTDGFSPRDNANETRQAQHTLSNDTVTDVNVNAVVARSQVLTVDGLGKGFASNQDRRDKIADAMMAKSVGQPAT